MENYLGESKYDGKIRRVTLIKKVANLLNMEDGDILQYYEKNGEIIIRKNDVASNSAELNKHYLEELTADELKIAVDAAMKISRYYRDGKIPGSSEITKIENEVSLNIPSSIPNNKKELLVKTAIEFAKNIISKTKVE